MPLDRKELAPDDRRAALEAFRSALIDSRGVELEVDDKPSSEGLHDAISPRAGARFITFVQTANKTNLESGLDRSRWYDFLIQLHRDRNRPPRDLLETALKDEAFCTEAIGQLLEVYDLADHFLSRYDAFGEEE